MQKKRRKFVQTSLNNEPVLFCSAACKEGFKADRKAGVIFPPTRIEWPDGTKQWARNREHASILGRFCAYCGESQTNTKKPQGTMVK